MERRMLLAVVLSILAVMSYSALTGRGCVPPQPPQENGTQDGEEPAAKDDGTQPAPKDDGTAAKKGAPKKDAPKKGNGAAEPGPAAAPDAAPLESHPQFGQPVARAKLESTELTVELTTTGGAIEAIRHNRAYESDRETPFDQVVWLDPLMAMGAIDDTGLIPPAAPGGAGRKNMKAGPLRLPQLPWTLASATDDEVVFTFKTPEGLTYRKAYTLADGEKRYDLTMKLSVSADEGVDAPETVALKVLAASGQLRERSTGAFLLPNSMIYRLSDSGDASDQFPHGLPVVELPTKGISRVRLRMLASRSTYFITSYYGTGAENEPEITHFWATGEQGDLRDDMEETLAKWYQEQRGVDLANNPDLLRRANEGIQQLHHAWIGMNLPVGAEEPTELKFYVGPTDRQTLAQEPYDALEPIVTYPNAPDFVADVLMWIYDFWRGLFGSAGLAIILMTLVVRGGMMPLSIRNQLSMRKYGRKVAKLKPKVKKLQQQYANNPKKLREEQMKLYREHGVGFPTGCLMMLIQIPIFFALFSSLRVEYTIRGESFLWINDLSGPDRLVDFGRTVLNLGFFWVESINILPILMVGLSIMHTRNMPKPADEQQAQQMKMMKWLPIIFAVILYNYTAALAIYMVLSSAVAIVESKVVRARDEADEESEQGSLPAAKSS
ncbi:MAG: membrane protein insertase YidC [Planctomycetota bacterium]|nr:membrane protein insertase YidC [Planctomycetota bacterium]